MRGPVKHVRRPYVSTRRTEAASATRRAIVEAATDRFLALGYAATTIRMVADAAAVSTKTVYAIHGNKRALLTAVLDHAIAGDAQSVAIADRPWVAAMIAEPDVRARLAILGREGAAILGRRAAVDAIIRRAADADPTLADLVDEARAQRRTGQATLLATALGDRPDERAIDTLFAIGSPEVYRLLVIDGGWSHPRFEAWYTATLIRQFAPVD